MSSSKKKITTLLGVLIISFSSFGKNKIILSDSLRQTISVLKENLDSSNRIIIESNESLNILEERIAQANESISTQSTIISSFETIYSILTIVFTIIGLLIPVVTYFFGIKPSRDQIKNLESNFDQKLEEYLKMSRKANIDKSIEGLLSNSAERKLNAITYLSLTQHEGLSDIQYFKLYRILTAENIDSAQKASIESILTGAENEYATEYCTSILRSGIPYKEDIPARYFGMIGVTDHIKKFVEYLQKSDKREETFLRIISVMKFISFVSVLEFFNSKEIIKLFNSKDFSNFKEWSTNIFEKGYEDDQIKETELYKLVFK